jgi:isopentenyl-diphosphate delta-isomerase
MEKVILVDEYDTETGFMEKIEAHQKALLHRAFSVFIFNNRNEMLLQQRNLDKYHSGGLWTNSCCSHPRPGEETTEAASRRLKEEMGFETPLVKIFEFTYKTSFANGLAEHEFDHVFAGYYDGPVAPDQQEVKNYAWESVPSIEEKLAENVLQFTEWFRIAFPMIKEWMVKQG